MKSLRREGDLFIDSGDRSCYCYKDAQPQCLEKPGRFRRVCTHESWGIFRVAQNRVILPINNGSHKAAFDREGSQQIE